MNPGNDVPWELPPEYHDEPDPLEEWPDFFADECPACRGTGWQDCGIIAIECPECGGVGDES